MKKFELRQIINEEIKKLLKEGATDIGREFIGTEQQLKKEFIKWQKNDKKQFGENPYGANWSNVPGLDIHKPTTIQNDKRMAIRYVQDNTEKWSNAIAVEYEKNKWVVGAIVPE